MEILRICVLELICCLCVSNLFVWFQGMESVKKEIDDLGHTGPYRPPARLRKRTEFSSKGAGDDSKVFEANEYASLSASLRGDFPSHRDLYLYHMKCVI